MRESISSKSPLALAPGILVSTKTYVRGGVVYQTHPLEATEEDLSLVHTPEAEVFVKRSTKVTDDPDEHERALKVRGAAWRKIAGVCSETPFGMLCQKAREEDLDKAILESEEMVRLFNASSKYTRVDVFTIKGYVADNDEKAAKAIAAELAELIDAMKQGVEARDEKAIRSAMRKAAAINSMINEDAQRRVSVALDMARSAAKEIAKTIKDKGHANLILVADTNKKILDEMSRSFTVLDLDEGEAVSAAPAQGLANELEIDEGGALSVADGIAAAVGSGELDLDDEEDLGLGDVDASAVVNADAAGFRDARETDARAARD